MVEGFMNRIVEHNRAKLFLVVCITIFSMQSMSCTSLVYNLKIRRVFSGFGTLVTYGSKIKHPIWLASAVPIFYHRTGYFVNERFGTDIREKRFGGGAIFNVRYIASRSWWAEGTTAVQKETVRARGTANFSASRTGLDDIIFSAGYNAFPSEESQVTIYGLAGFPTRTRVTAQEAQDRLVGTRFYGLGGGLEGSYSFITTQEKMLAGILQVRTIYFFPRCWEPIIPGRIHPGFVTDLLLSLRYRTGLTAIEGGYNPSFATGQALILPTETIRSRPAVRHGCFASVMHLTERLRFFDKPVAVGTGIIVNRLGRFDATSVSWWGNITVIF